MFQTKHMKDTAKIRNYRYVNQFRLGTTNGSRSRLFFILSTIPIRIRFIKKDNCFEYRYVCKESIK